MLALLFGDNQQCINQNAVMHWVLPKKVFPQDNNDAIFKLAGDYTWNLKHPEKIGKWVLKEKYENYLFEPR